MISTKEKAYAKLNLSLDVTAKRPDGYHEMLMVMQTVTLCDELDVTLREGRPSVAHCNLHFVPSDGRNLAVRAANTFFERAGIKNTGAEIGLYKRIPVGAGMAGGSSDAAAVLRALNRLCETHYSAEELCSLACEVGSDVAFCVRGGTMLAQGRGEKLTPLPPMPDCKIVIAKPDFSISTPELFKKLDSIKLRCRPDTDGLCEALRNGDLQRLARRMYNVFEDVPDRRHAAISEIKHILLDHGAYGAVMTGTGSAVFGIFGDADKAWSAQKELAREYRLCYVTENQPALVI